MPARSTDEEVRELPHTADIGFEVRAPTLPRLFELAARGLVSALGFDPAGVAPRGDGTDARGAPPGETERIALERPDRDRLLVAWLGELLYRSTAQRRLPAGVRVRLPGAARLEADVAWRPWGEETPVREIKGVTYHGLEVAEKEGGWHARVVLDV